MLRTNSTFIARRGSFIHIMQPHWHGSGVWGLTLIVTSLNHLLNHFRLSATGRNTNAENLWESYCEEEDYHGQGGFRDTSTIWMLEQMQLHSNNCISCKYKLYVQQDIFLCPIFSFLMFPKHLLLYLEFQKGRVHRPFKYTDVTKVKVLLWPQRGSDAYHMLLFISVTLANHIP